jgi:phosphoglycerol geranylgeranyltransferase
MPPGQLLRSVASAVNLATVAGRTLLGMDTNPVPADWTHISKVDPEGEKRLPLGFPLYLSETSAVSVGGSRDVTAGNTEETMGLVAATGAPMLHEPSGAGHVTEQTREDAELLAIPEVLNGESEALVGTLGKGLDYVRGELGPGLVEDRIGIPLDGDGLVGERLGNLAAAYLMQEAVFEAYIIMNPDSAAAREAGVTEADLLSPTAARERALAAEYHLESEVVYLEYSGTFGGEEAVRMLDELDDALTTPRVWYGGGLDSAEKADTVLDAGADAVVVGDILHDIADAEADLVGRAREAFEAAPDHPRLVDWVEETVDVGETSAMRYLSTIPEVDDAAAMATEYLAAGVEFALVVDALAGRLDDPDGADVAESLREDARLPETRLAGALDGEQTDLPRRLAVTLLAERFDIDIDDAFAGRHLGIELTR